MKKNIKQVDYMNKNIPGNWWIWDAYCDICGVQVRNANVYSSIKPNEKKKDYCLRCVEKLLDDQIKC